jgi:hypothetical protein
MKNILLALVIGLATIACKSEPAPKTAAVELKHFPLDSMEGVRATTGASFDPKISADGKGSLRVEAKEPVTVPLFEVTDVGVENASLIYMAKLQSENLDGKALLEMWLDDCRDSFFPGDRAKAGSHSAQPGDTGKRTSLDR